MRAFDFSPLYRTAIGVDRLASMLDTASRLDTQANSYPPYNIERRGEDAYRITMAVAGFAESELELVVKDGTLTISGNKAPESEDDKPTYLYQGIAARGFERRFQLADHVQVKGAALENGLLHVDLVREVPEALKPRTIEITSGRPATKTIENKAA